MFVLLGLSGVTVLGAGDSEVKIEAKGSVDYDFDSNLTTATEGVVMTGEDLVVEADSLIYDGDLEVAEATGRVRMTRGKMTLTAAKLTFNNHTGWLEATGGVRVVSEREEYRTETIRYNLKDSSGQLGQFTGTVAGVDRDYRIAGGQASLSGETMEVKDAGLTRCPKPNPDYWFSAKQIRLSGEEIHLERVVLKLKGVPVFYYPRLTLKQGKRLPRFDLGYNKDDGMRFNYEYTSPVNSHQDWRFRGELNSREPSKIAMGLGNNWDHFNNAFDIEYNSDGFLTMVHEFEADYPLLKFRLDGRADLASEAEREARATLTRKYWETPIGNWQAGLTAGYLYQHTGSGIDEGVFGGYRLDYNPSRFWTLSYLQLYDLHGGDWNQLQEEFLDDYKLGGNLLYDINLPLNDQLRFMVSGTYNFDRSDWIRQVYGFVSDGCCFKTTLGWDVAEDSLELAFQIKL